MLRIFFLLGDLGVLGAFLPAFGYQVDAAAAQWQDEHQQHQEQTQGFAACPGRRLRQQPHD